jgi:heme exporter protein C
MRKGLAISRGLDLLALPLVVLALYMAFVYAPEAIFPTGQGGVATRVSPETAAAGGSVAASGSDRAASAPGSETGVGGVPAPPVRSMGAVQRIFYFHVPCAMVSFLAFAVVLVGSIGFLVRGDRRWDDVAHAAVEVGFFFCTLVLVTGPVWARSAWGVWWTWDARLTSTLLLWMIYASYLLLRSYLADDPRVQRYASVLGILGALNVPIVYFSVKWFRTMHPTTFITEPGGLDPQMATALRVCLLAVLVLFLSVLTKRVLLGRLWAERGRLQVLVEAAEREA